MLLNENRYEVHMDNKKKYIKPIIKRVPLRPEEAVLGFCKTDASQGPLQSICNVPSQCYSLGS